MDRKLIVTVKGDCTENGEHITTIKRPDGEEIGFYTDGWEGISFTDIVRILDFLEIDYFDVRKEIGKRL